MATHETETPTDDTRYAGTIVRIVTDTETGQSKGFGFADVAVKGEVREVFVHRSNCVDDFETLREGMSITCAVTNTAKGLRALDVRRVA